MLIANTDIEAKQLIELYDADPGRVEVVHPGVDLDVFRPVPKAPGPRRRWGCPPTPTSCSSPAGSSRSRRPTCCCARWPSCSSASRAAAPGSWSRSSAARPAPGSTSRRRWPTWRPSSASPTSSGSCRPVSQDELAQWYAAATAGRRAVVQRVLRAGRRRGAGDRDPGRRRRGRRPDHRGPRRPQRPAGRRARPDDWADALRRVLGDDELRARLEAGALAQAAAVLVGRHRRGDARGLRARPLAPRLSEPQCDRPGGARSAPTSRPTSSSTTSRSPASSRSPCPARRSCRPRSGSTSAPTPSVCTPSSAAVPTRTTSASTSGCSSATCRLYGVAFAVDRLGDIYLDGRLPLSVVEDADELDRLLGAVLTTADESFNTILELGFASSIRKEWEWRTAARRVDPQPRGVPRLARGRRGELRTAARTSTNATSAGSACTNRIRRLTVTAPYAPATMTQARKNSFTSVVVVDQPPDQPGGQEAVVEALVGGERLALRRERGVEAERLVPGRGVPEEHLEHQEVEVQGGDQADQDVRDDAHRVSMAGLGRGCRRRPIGLRCAACGGRPPHRPARARRRRTPSSGGVSPRKSQPITIVIGGTR